MTCSNMLRLNLRKTMLGANWPVTCEISSQGHDVINQSTVPGVKFTEIW